MSEVFYAAIKQLFPGVVSEYKFHPVRKWRFDYAWPAHYLALEVEGGIWSQGRHTRGKGYLGDLAKYNEANLLGWRVYRVSTQQLKSGEAISLLEQAFAAHLKTQQLSVERKSEKWRNNV